MGGILPNFKIVVLACNALPFLDFQGGIAEGNWRGKTAGVDHSKTIKDLESVGQLGKNGLGH